MKTTFRKLTAAWPVAIFLLLPALTPAETAVQAWVQRYNGPASGEDQACAVAVDSSNNVIVTGYSWVSGSSYDYLTIKYSSAGEPLWTNRYNGPGNWDDQACAVAMDGSDNVIVTGYTRGNLTWSSFTYATVKYSSAGVPLWAKLYGSSMSVSQARAVAVDGNNNVIVTGFAAGISNYDYATVKYSSAGLLLWTNHYSGPGNHRDYASAVAVDSSNSVIVTGYSIGSGSTNDYATIKYSSAGVPLWTNRYNGPGNGDDEARAMALDASNNVIVTGWSTNSGSGYDYATITYASTGVPLSTNRYNGPANGSDLARHVAVDSSNNVIVTGCSWGGESSYDYATVKYSSGGVPLWTNRYNGPGNGDDQAYAVAVDVSNNVLVTGFSLGIESSYNYATIGYSSAGVPLWTNRYNGPGNGDDRSMAAAVDSSGNPIITGYSPGSASGNDFATIKYTFPLVITDFRLTNGTFEMLLDNLQPGTLVIEASTNLSATPPGWSPVFTNTTPTNVLFYTAPETGSLPTRFYRAFQYP